MVVSRFRKKLGGLFGPDGLVAPLTPEEAKDLEAGEGTDPNDAESGSLRARVVVEDGTERLVIRRNGAEDEKARASSRRAGPSVRPKGTPK